MTTKLHITSQKTVMFTGLFTVMRISNLAYIYFNSNSCWMPIHVNKKGLCLNYKDKQAHSLHYNCLHQQATVIRGVYIYSPKLLHLPPAWRNSSVISVLLNFSYTLHKVCLRFVLRSLVVYFYPASVNAV
jgi:hypothetical protein